MSDEEIHVINDLKVARGRWLDHISGLVMTAPAKSSFGTGVVPALTGVERALIELHAGLTHLEGGDRDQASLGEFCSPDEADQIIGRWRSGRQSAHVMGELRDVWQALWYMGAWTDCLRSDLSDCRRRVNPGHFRRSKSERLRAV